MKKCNIFIFFHFLLTSGINIEVLTLPIDRTMSKYLRARIAESFT